MTQENFNMKEIRKNARETYRLYKNMPINIIFGAIFHWVELDNYVYNMTA